MSSDSGLNPSEVQSALAAIHFIFTSACKYETNSTALSEEIAQLGIPQENAVALSKVYAENLSAMSHELSKSFIRSKAYVVNRFQYIDWKVDYDFVTKNTLAAVNVRTDKFDQHVVMNSGQLDLLSHELIRAKKIMEKMLVRD